MLTSTSFLDVFAKHPSEFLPTSLILTNLFKIQTYSVYYIQASGKTTCEPARWSGMSGSMANPAPNTPERPGLKYILDTWHSKPRGRRDLRDASEHSSAESSGSTLSAPWRTRQGPRATPRWWLFLSATCMRLACCTSTSVSLTSLPLPTSVSL